MAGSTQSCQARSMRADPNAIDVIAPNLKRRLSGVTATIARLVPVQARSIGIATCGPDVMGDLPRLTAMQLATLPRDRPRVWHARRNTEMLAGLALRHLARRRLRLLFTSASQREHSAYTKWLVARMDALVATSARGAAYLDRPAEVIMHGIDTETFRPAEDRASLRERLGLPDRPLIGCYGRVRAQKGTGDFVEAMRTALDGREGTALVMGRATAEHRAYEAELRDGAGPRVRFLPEVPVTAMPDWYAALDLFVAPQRWEGFGLTPLEAMASGVPVVATDVGAFPELIVEGETGFVVPARDVEAMAERVALLLGNPERRRAMGEAARAHVAARFRIEDEAEALAAIYRRLLGA